MCLFYDELDRGRRERAEAHLSAHERLAAPEPSQARAPAPAVRKGGAGGCPIQLRKDGDLWAVTIAAYKRRVADLREDAAEAEARGDFHRASALREELEALEDELARGLGLGGRARKLAAPAERARINVQKRLKDAMGRIGAALPEAGRHLEATVRTGALCLYDPHWH